MSTDLLCQQCGRVSYRLRVQVAPPMDQGEVNAACFEGEKCLAVALANTRRELADVRETLRLVDIDRGAVLAMLAVAQEDLVEARVEVARLKDRLAPRAKEATVVLCSNCYDDGDPCGYCGKGGTFSAAVDKAQEST